MARQIDNGKIESIKNATMETIVEYGIEKTTIAMIAKKSKVSAGYLYRLYNGKDDLIKSLYYDKVKALLFELQLLLEQHPNSVAKILNRLVENRITYAKNEPIASKFFYQLIHNDNFILTPELREQNNLLISRFKEIGIKTGEISESKDHLEIQYHIILYVVNYLNFQKNNFFGIDYSKNIKSEYLVNNILTILKKDS